MDIEPRLFRVDTSAIGRSLAMGHNPTTTAVRRYLDNLAGDTPADPTIRLLDPCASTGSRRCVPTGSTGATCVWCSRR